MNAKEKFAAVLKDMKGIDPASKASAAATPSPRRARRRRFHFSTRDFINMETALRECQKRAAKLETLLREATSGEFWKKNKRAKFNIRNLVTLQRQVEKLRAENNRLRAELKRKS
jgi:hypothetical protein